MSSDTVPASDPFPGIPLKQVSTKRKGDKDQPKSNEVFFINENFKDTTPQIAELIKVIAKYQQTVEVLADLGAQVSDLVKHIGQTNDSTLGQEMASIGEALSLIEINRKNKLTEVGVEMWNSEMTLDQRSKEMALFERDYKKKHTDCYKEIRRLQQQKQKFHKGTVNKKEKIKAKSEAKYEETSKLLTEKIEEIDTYESQKLQEVILIERKRYTALLSLLCKTTQAIAEHSESTLASIRPHEKRWAEASRAENVIPDRLQQLIAAKPVITNDTPAIGGSSSSTDLLRERGDSFGASTSTTPRNSSGDLEKKDNNKKKEEKEKKKKDKKDSKKTKDEPAQKVQGLYQWVPRAADELAIEVGMEVTLIEEVNEEWWLCSNGEKQGLVPSNYVKKL